MGRAVARMRQKRNTYRILVGEPEERDHEEDQGADRWIILKRTLEK
jgi:hypothetical protein